MKKIILLKNKKLSAERNYTVQHLRIDKSPTMADFVPKFYQFFFFKN